jgi:hypothetical protein
MKMQLSNERCEVIDAKELARRWNLPESWIREQTRTRASDPLPCVRFGRYVRFEWNSPNLAAWYERRRSYNKNDRPARSVGPN